MADPVSIIGAIGVAATAAQTILTTISNIQEAPQEICSLQAEIKNLTAILAGAKDYCTRAQWISDRVLLETIKQCADDCENTLKPLDEVLKPLARSGRRLRPLIAVQWVIKKGEIKLMRSRMTDAKATLSMAVLVLNGHVSGKGQEKILAEMASEFEKVRQDFLTVQRRDAIRERLEKDLDTVTEASVVEDGQRTERDFAMRRFLATPEEPDFLPTPTELHDAFIKAIVTDNVAEALRLLSDAPASYNADEDPEGYSVLHFCALHNARETAKLFIERRAAIDVRDNNGITPFNLAIDKKAWDVATLLMDSGCIMGDFPDHFFDFMSQIEHPSTVRPVIRSLSKRLNDEKDGPFLVHRAVYQKDTLYLNILLDEGFDPDASDCGIRPIHVACLRDLPACVNILAEHGADLDAILPATAHQFLRSNRNYHTLVMDLGVQDHIPVKHLCRAEGDNIGTLRALIKNGAKLDVPFEPDGDVLLLNICAGIFWPATQLVVKAGANPNVQNNYGQFPLFWAVACSNYPLIELLLEYGANINLQTNRTHGSWTALHKALHDRNFQAAKLLIQHGADLTLEDSHGETPPELGKRIGAPQLFD
ncbi:ankyrin repeat-containing domain protein [Hypomontagnella submonticulosa]|nr:ankyrin repeat-containing domain protein [Hypomontagnella submonticulosa]